MFNYFRVCAATPEITVGDPAKNADKIIGLMKTAAQSQPDLVVFPELCLTGSGLKSLFLQDAMRIAVTEALKKILDAGAEYDFAVVVGAPVQKGSRLYDCAVIMAKGRILGFVPKTGVSRGESVWFSGFPCGDFDGLSFMGEGYPFGTGLKYDIKNACVAFEVGSDIFSAIPPSSYTALTGADIIVNPFAAGELAGRDEYIKQLVVTQSAKLHAGYVLAAAGFGESTSEYVFAGHSLIAENGRLLAESDNGIDKADVLTFADIDTDILRHEKISDRSFDITLVPAEHDGEYGCCSELTGDSVSDGSLRHISQTPFVPSDEAERRERCLRIFCTQAAALKKRLLVTRSVPVIGVSGGLDSTLALLVSRESMRMLGRSAGDIVGITLPGYGTSGRTYQNAVELMRTLGTGVRKINIRAACDQHFKDIGHDPSELNTTFENAQARERTQVLMDVANECGGLVVGTGDLSELSLGWCTYNGDHMSMYGVNCGVPKTLIRWIIEAVASLDEYSAAAGVLRDIIDTPISPELLPADENGKIAQQTESLVGPYLLNDFFLYYTVRYGFTAEKIRHVAGRAFAGTYSGDEIGEKLSQFYKRFYVSQFKRSCSPDGVRIGSVAFSDDGWTMPSDASPEI